MKALALLLFLAMGCDFGREERVAPNESRNCANVWGHEQVCVGDIWFWSNKNPFNLVEKRYEVLAIRGDYVQYKNTENGVIESSTLKWFVAGSYRVSEKK